MQANDTNNLARPWSKHSEGSSKFEKLQGRAAGAAAAAAGGEKRKREATSVTIEMGAKTDTAKLLQAVYGDDPKLREFVEAHENRNKAPVWGNAVRFCSVFAQRLLTFAHILLTFCSRLTQVGDSNKKSKKSAAKVRVNERQSKKAGGDEAPMLKQTHVTFGSESESDDEYEDMPTGKSSPPHPRLTRASPS